MIGKKRPFTDCGGKPLYTNAGRQHQGRPPHMFICSLEQLVDCCVKQVSGIDDDSSNPLNSTYSVLKGTGYFQLYCFIKLK